MYLIDSLTKATDWTDGVFAAVSPDRYSEPTPCAEWDVRTLANHLVGGAWMFATALAGGSLPAGGQSDLVGDDAQGAYRDAVAALAKSAALPGVMDRPTELPIGTVPGQVALSLALLDTVVHGWDLATATGQRASIPDDLATLAETIARQGISDSLRGPGMPFGPQIALEADAPVADRLVAFLGREPHP